MSLATMSPTCVWPFSCSSQPSNASADASAEKAHHLARCDESQRVSLATLHSRSRTLPATGVLRRGRGRRGLAQRALFLNGECSAFPVAGVSNGCDTCFYAPTTRAAGVSVHTTPPCRHCSPPSHNGSATGASSAPLATSHPLRFCLALFFVPFILKGQYPAFHSRELAANWYATAGRRPSPHTVRRILADGLVPSRRGRRYPHAPKRLNSSAP